MKKVRWIIEEVALVVFLLSIFTWLLTGLEMLVFGTNMMVVIAITKELMLWSMVVFMGAAWWGTIKRTFKRIRFKLLEF